MKPIATLLLAVLLVFTTGCSTRENPKHPEGTPPTSTDSSSLEETPEESMPSEPSSTEEPTEEEEDRITDPGLVAKAEEIVRPLLDRAETCNTLYQGNLPYDKNMPETAFEGVNYRLIADDRFANLQLVTSYWQQTFAPGPISDALFEKISQRKIYVPSNGELYGIATPETDAITVGEWDPSTLHLLEHTAETLVVSMETQLVGSDNGRQTLTMHYKNGSWLLTDSYFLD